MEILYESTVANLSIFYQQRTPSLFDACRHMLDFVQMQPVSMASMIRTMCKLLRVYSRPLQLA